MTPTGLLAVTCANGRLPLGQAVAGSPGSVSSLLVRRWRFGKQQRRPDDSVGHLTTPAAVRLRHRLDRCTTAENVRPALEHAALVEASAVLDEVLGDKSPVDVAAARAIADLSLLHRIRAMGLGDPVEELHACVALQVLAYVIDPAAVAPQTYEEVTRAINGGAETDLPTARLRALQGHASAVRAGWLREPDPELADTFVCAFQRLVDAAGPDVPNWPTRLDRSRGSARPAVPGVRARRRAHRPRRRHPAHR